MSEVVYPPVIAASKLMFKVLDLKIRVEGAENVPRTGGAVLASNHIGYLDFIFAGFGAHPAKRMVRFMAKQEVFKHRISGPLMRGMKHIPVDRESGVQSFRDALTALKSGEVVGIFPEATISRSFTVKDVKSGATRLAMSAGVPLIPLALWGTHRLWTKGRPRTLTRRHTPITILVGEPMQVNRKDDVNAATAELRRRMSALVEKAQREYPDKPKDDEDRWWLPAYLGGTAPQPAAAPAA
ncbi:lysophospholipid acyltransferase family protein [Catenuloplanes atrovinosus]|uniref:1-acyl-sn-glycerol-3-phosphate acyltransferase n=1 Tax=Catenuloplanes atrovinosus TaxID=137266 RepID=A0AAE4CDU6_9ACTN|nr:lysophospholipid acyltransferase family protein [Catenuloplanes atrovinosus]MDR7277905.1 1-acyl-sn-glycerol-3-phosphate acyltransferase [Catenuloplanes atrovinosus]